MRDGVGVNTLCCGCLCNVLGPEQGDIRDLEGSSSKIVLCVTKLRSA